MSLRFFVCLRCETTQFPSRFYCPVCGNAQFREVDPGVGKIAQVTTVRAAKNSVGGPRLFASVTTASGPIVIAEVSAECSEGAKVRFTIDAEGRITGSPA